MLLEKLIKENEPSIKKTLESLSEIAVNLKFIKGLHRVYQYSDEPKIYQYSASISLTEKQTDGDLNVSNRGGGSSFFSKEEAFLKCFCESIERHACTIYKRNGLITGSYQKYKKSALNLDSVAGFSNEQKKSMYFERTNFTQQTQFSWISGYSLKGYQTLIPAQLVYFNYKLNPEEAMLYVPMSTGAAGGGCLSSAITRGILEIVERDAFIIYYLNKLPGYKVNLKSIPDKRIRLILQTLKRYKLEAHVIDITTDLCIPSFLSIVIDRTQIGPAIQMGLKSALNPIDAIVNSLQEAVHVRNWARQVHEDEYKENITIDPINIKTIKERAMFWYKTEMLKYLDFWLNQEETSLRHESLFINTYSGKELNLLNEIFNKNKYSVYYVDLTLPQLEKSGYKVVKVIIPQLQPFYLHERYKCLGGKRLHEVPPKMGYPMKKSEELNQLPHPFL